MRERKLSEYGKIKYKEALEKGEFTQNNSGNKLTQEQLAKLANVSLDTVQRLLGTKHKDDPNRVARWAVENIVKVLGMEPTDIVDVKDWYPQQQLPLEFKPGFLTSSKKSIYMT
ncbi:XRE family transcriptional regulator [Nostoc sphaeroides CCNUC1]|uniref:XRE family transcriptional regulator n=2 Tax=Nostoc sphaeroides TaxID=446679 RepID=A0A5P8WD64_9NOSO|nr:XRE family transcriptional regulator [Nostoc sphaeroides CCNUC1]